MKHIRIAFAALVGVVLLASCVSSKKIVYFQGADDLYKEAQAISQQFDMRIKPADNIMVKVSCNQPELLEVFTNSTIIGAAGTSSSSMQTGSSSTINTTYGFTVNHDGDVILPILGKVHVGGLTTEEASVAIAQRIVEAQIVNDPEVNVKLMNARVAVIGGVRNPGVYNLTSERNTIVEVLAQSGDIADDGLKTNIKVFREVNGVRQMYTINLTDVDVFRSPAFYVQQNDLVYVQPNRAKNIKNSSFYTFLSAGSSMIAAISSLLSLYIVLDKL